jgi:hypothetical protein
MWSVVDQIAGVQSISYRNTPDTVARCQPGLIVNAESSYWGGAEFIYVYANGSIRQNGLVVLTQSFQNGAWRWDATEVPNTANLGRTIGVAQTAMSSGQFGWVMVSGITPVNCNASVAADTTFGIAAAGQGGANSAGKQILNARIIGAGSITAAKANCAANSGSTQLLVPNSDGWFPGVYLSGTGIQAGTTVSSIDQSGNIVTLSAATSAIVAGTVTATYNNATIFYNVAHLNRPFAQGAIT